LSKFVQKMLLPLVATSLGAIGMTSVAGAEEHVVSQQELRKDVLTSAKARRANQKKLEGFLKTPAAREAMRQTGVDYKTVEKGVRTLSDAELAQLAARTAKAQADFSAGLLGFAELLLIAIAVIVIIVVVAAA
jgi:hypothetical protein